MDYLSETMPSVKIQKQCKHAPKDTFNRISELLSNDKELRKLDPSYKTDFNAKNLTGTATGNLFKASMNVKDHADGSALEITIELPFHLALAKGMVEKTLNKKL